MDTEDMSVQDRMDGLVKRLHDTLDQFLSGLYGIHEECIDMSCVNRMLSELQELNREEGKKEYNSLTEILDVWYKFQIWQFNCVFSSKKQSEILKCLFLMSSLILNWTDRSHEFRLSLVNNEYLFYHVMQLKALESIRSTKVAEDLGAFNISIITNCAQELNFYGYISTVNWKDLLHPWINYSSKDLQFQTRLLCSYIASSLNCTDLKILDMECTDLKILLTMLGEASTSTELKATGFGFTFSATEILESLLNLFISHNNLMLALRMDLIPTVLALLLNSCSKGQLLTCQLLWIILGESHFQWNQEQYCSSIKEMLTGLVTSDDKSLQVFAKLVLSEPCFGLKDYKDDLQVVNDFFKLLPDQWYRIGQSIGLNENYKFILHLSASSVNKRVLFVILLQKLDFVGEFLNQLSLSSDIVASSNDYIYTELSSDPAYPQSVWMKKVLLSCELMTQKFLNASSADKTDLFPIVAQFWRQISELSNVCIQKVLKAAVDECSSASSVWHTIYELLTLLYKAEMSGLGTREIQICLLRLITILRNWCSVSKVLCSSLLSRGLIINHCNQVLNWTRKNGGQMVVYMVKANLRILISCLHCNAFKVYVKAFDWFTTLAQLHSTNIPAIRLATKIISSYLSSYNSELFTEGLSEADVNEILDITAKAAGSSYELDKFTFYSLDMILCLQKYIEHDNIDLAVLTQAPILPVIVTIFSDGTSEEKSSISLLVWNILSAKKYNLCENVLYSELLQVLKDCEETKEITSIAKSIIASCDKDFAEWSAENFNLLIETTYKYGRYAECVSWCLKKENCSITDAENLETKVVRAKALYCMYKNEEGKLHFSLSTSSKGEYFKALQKCYDKTKEVISLLGMAHDKNSLDSEGSKMLALSMMDIIHTTNKLNECKRCYLCWKKLTTKEKASETEGSSDHSKLIRSHPIPYSLLSRFAQSVPTKSNLKIFRLTAEGTQKEPHKGNVYAPKQITQFMFCTSCEGILSAKGEAQFVRDFFDKIYDISNPSKPCQSQVIPYGKWLYHFCTGMIYRNLIWEANSFLNEEELYKLLLGCRQYILSSELSENSPELYLLMTPLSGNEEDLKHGSINNVLSGSLEWYIGRHKLSHKTLDDEDAVLASFFLFHVGALNILVKLSPSQAYSLDDSFKVKATNSQVYSVPDEKDRKQALPPGLWAHLLSEARHMEQEGLISASNSDKRPDSKFPKAVETFGIVDGAAQQLSEIALHGIQPSPDKSEKNFNFLPAGLEVRSKNKPNSVSLPNGHLILLHHTFTHGAGTGETIFIVRNAIEDTCYLIWHNFIPGLQYSVAFNLSSSEMLLTDAITDKKPPNAFQSPHFQATLDDARKKLSSALPMVLLQKGIFSLQSLLLRARRIGSFPSVDMKCDKETKCWFCSNRCNICFKILGLNSIKSQISGTEVAVCSQDCAWYLPRGKIQTTILVASPEESPPPPYEYRGCPLFEAHRKYFHVYIEDTAEHLPMKGDIAVCFGDGGAEYPKDKMYGVLCTRSIHKQILFEFFLSDSFDLLGPLPHDVANDFLITVINKNQDIKQYLCLAYDEFKKPSALDFHGIGGHSGVDELYTMVCGIANDMQSPVSESVVDEIRMKLHSWNKDFNVLPSEDRDILSLLITTNSEVVKNFLTFADSLFSEGRSKQQCLWSLNQTFALWSSTTSLMQQALVENGLMVGVLLELQSFRNMPSSEDMLHLIQLCLSILCNLLQVRSNRAYFMNTVCDQIVGYFITSTDLNIQILSTSILCYLVPKLPPDIKLEMEMAAVKLMLDLVPDSIAHEGIIFHPAPLLVSLRMIIKFSETNARKFISQGLLSMMSKIIAHCNIILQREIILILWTLASYSVFEEAIKLEIDLLGTVHSLANSDDHQLAMASMCALWDIDELPKDGAGHIAFAYGCYKFCMYERCNSISGDILQLSTSDSDVQKIRLLKGKSLFHLCNEGILRLPKIISPSDLKIKTILVSCTQCATEAVKLLGSAYDQNYIDEEGMKYLDLCMMFLISSSNALNKCQRCLLCLTNLNLKKDKIGQETITKQGKGLQHSHVVPKAILEAFTSGLIKTKSQRLFQFCGTETNLSQLKSAKEGTYYILCSECEQLFGTFENRFVNNFFKKIYDVSNPKAPCEAQEIEYKSWLYQFCISLFFRGIAILDVPCNDAVKRFQNSEKMYEIFVRCRQILLKPSNTKENFPSVHVLINPTIPTSEERQAYTTIHEAFVSPEMLGIAAEKDPKKYFVGTSKANVFLAHIGIINIVVDVEGVLPSQDHLINPSGGLYQVPHDSNRDQFLTPDIKEIFYTSAEQMEVQKETISDRQKKSHWAKGVIKHPPSDREQTFMVHPAQRKDLEVFHQEGVRPSQVRSKDKVVSFLPPGIKIMQTSGVLELPPGHQVLFHCEPDRAMYQGPNSNSDTGITVFLAIGDGSKAYPVDKPYAIYHKYEPGLQFSMAMFVSNTDLSLSSLITCGSGQQRAEMLFNDFHFQENMQLTLKTALYRMGFASFKSFFPHSHEKRIQFKCQRKRRCWYCNDRCDNCMAVAAVGLTKKRSDVVVKFCSKSCSEEFDCNLRVLNLLPSPFRLTSDTSKITALPPTGHKMLQRVIDHFDEDKESLASTHTVRVCTGNTVEYPKDKVYIIYEISTILSQTFVAMFVGDDFSLSPIVNEPQTEIALWFCRRIQPHVQSVLNYVASEAQFLSFKEWCTAAIDEKESYFASNPFYYCY